MRIVKVDIPFVYGGTAYRETFLFTRSPTKEELLATIHMDFNPYSGIQNAIIEVVKQIDSIPKVSSYDQACKLPVVLTQVVENPHISIDLVPVCNPDLD